jgi:hypothetical protein
MPIASSTFKARPVVPSSQAFAADRRGSQAARLAHGDGRVWGEVPPRFLQEGGRRTAFEAQEPVDRLRAQIPLPTDITEQHRTVAPSKKKRGAQPRGFAADNEHTNFMEGLRCLGI